MSSSWTDRQGQVGDLRNKSKDELIELLIRQEKMLANRGLLQTLPDKGKRIKDFADKVRLAVEHHSEEERRQSLVSTARTELQSKYQQAFTIQHRAVSTASDTNEAAAAAAAAAAGIAVQERDNSPVSAGVQEKTSLDGSAVETMETVLNSYETKDGGLVEALEKVTLSGTSTGFSSQSKETSKSGEMDNYFFRKQIPKKPHYVEILEKTQTSSAPRKQKFKPNQLPHRNDTSPSSPTQSSDDSSSLSAQARRERDRKHLDDITAARLPPLHHSPAQLLSAEESAILLKEQTKKQQELQAKLAAQKLSEGLKISMGSYTPDGGPMAAYREVHDEGAQLSSDED